MFPRIQAIVSAIPWAKVYFCSHFVNALILAFAPSRRLTSLFSGRSRCSSQTLLALGFYWAIISCAKSPIEISCWVAMLISSPMACSDSAMAMKPAAVSFT